MSNMIELRTNRSPCNRVSFWSLVSSRVIDSLIRKTLTTNNSPHFHKSQRLRQPPTGEHDIRAILGSQPGRFIVQSILRACHRLDVETEFDRQVPPLTGAFAKPLCCARSEGSENEAGRTESNEYHRLTQPFQVPQSPFFILRSRPLRCTASSGHLGLEFFE